MAARLTTEQFIEQAISIHGDKYDYSKVEYINSKKSVVIVCSKHQQFSQVAGVHLRGGNCPSCTHDEYRAIHQLGKKEFVAKSVLVHGDKYVYDDVEYETSHKHVKIVCRIHGEFSQTPTRHLAGSGCQKCAKISRSKKNTSSLQKFVRKARDVHDNKYDYSKSDYISATSKIEIICGSHGSFYQTPNSHLCGSGCPNCGLLESHNRLNLEDFINKANAIHGDIYDYSKSVYVTQLVKIEIGCKKHGSFWQAPTNHYKGQGCPICNISVPHRLVTQYLDSLGVEYEINNRSVLDGLEIDVWVPGQNFGIEINGCYWHGAKSIDENSNAKDRHFMKYVRSIEKNISLYQFWDHEILSNFSLIESMISYKLGKLRKIGARKCSFKKCTNSEVSGFMNLSHLQSHRNARLNYGLFYDGDLVSLLSFSKHPKHEWEVIRYASLPGYSVQGGFSKLFSKFISDFDPSEILTFADCRISEGNLYLKNGFVFESYTTPNYFYYKAGNVYSRQRCQKHKLNRLLGDCFDPGCSEFENMLNNGYVRTYDAGHLKLLWNKII